jgi:lipoyl(octanoyl) transferase
MSVEIKKSIKPVKYLDALRFMEQRLLDINSKKSRDLIWILEHEDLYTAGKNYKDDEILDKSINILKTNRGGKITYHGPGQLICYFVIDLKKRNKDIRKFVSIIEKTIIETLNYYGIETFSDRKNIGIWYRDNSKIKKIAAIGIRVSKWIAYHGFSININNDLKKYKAIIPCGIKDKEVTNLKKIKDQNYNKIDDKLIKNFILNLKKKVV